eukprot:1245954-Rhodomonas_salina.1
MISARAQRKQPHSLKRAAQGHSQVEGAGHMYKITIFLVATSSSMVFDLMLTLTRSGTTRICPDRIEA